MSAFSAALPWTSRHSQPGETEKQRKWRIFWSYLPDWILTIFLWAIFYLLDKIDGYRRYFSVTNESLAYPYAEHERIPVWLLAVIAGIVPAVVMLLISGLVRRSFWDAHSAILGFILALGLGVTITDIIKITVGRPRPDLFSRCQLPDNLTSNPVHGLTSWQSCTRFDLLQDGFRSFPSGHSSFAWTGMWYFILYLAAKFRLSNKAGYTWKSWVLLAPLSCALLVSISRTMDYRHHATDVIGGAVIGILTGWYGYRQYYPPVSAPQSYKPYSPRIHRSKDHNDLPLHLKDSAQNGHISRPSTEPLAAPNGYGASYAAQTPAGVFAPGNTGGAMDGVAQPGYAYTQGSNRLGHQDYAPPAMGNNASNASGYSSSTAYGNGQTAAYTNRPHSEDVETVPRPQV